MQVGITAQELAKTHPVLFHLSAAGSWPAIRRHGLLSTSALLDLFEVAGEERRSLESRLRADFVELRHPAHGRAVLRDQRPMNERALERALGGGLGVGEWLRVLNAKVFFWVARERLERLRNARACRGRAHTVLEVDTRELLARHAPRVTLAPINTGATLFSAPRGRATFRPLADYPYAERRRRGREPLVELCVEHAVPDVGELVLRVTEIHPERGERTLWERPAGRGAAPWR